ncbi:MAG: YkgJ family cysteine cluster protein [Bryobacteraceae bacterium]
MESDRPLPGAANLRFACQPGCTRCCTQKGFVYLTEQDVERAAQFLGISAAEFERRYVYRTKNQRRLRVPRQANCTFLTSEGCSIHQAKPLQCRIFPFWPELLEDKREWKQTARWCPGIGKGELVHIEAARGLAQEMRDAYPRMYR